VTLSFPPPSKGTFDPATATPNNCYGAPIATSDGQSIICGGSATSVLNFADNTNVGVWVFSAQTGKLTTTWDRHSSGGAFMVFPHVIWASPTGDATVSTGLTDTNQGATLDVRSASGQLRQIPWPGLIHEPELVNIIEPAIAW
jgi:hypothetical protein